MTPRLLRDLQILALQAVESPDLDAFQRKIERWYSREFSTPLAEVEKLDTIHIFQTYYEDQFGTMYTPDDKEGMERFERMKTAICFPEEVAEVESEDEQWEEEMLRDIANQNKAATEAAQKVVSEPIPDPNNSPNTMQETLDNGEEIVMSGEDTLPTEFED